MHIRGITKADYDHVVSVLDRWWGGPSREQAHPIFFYELGRYALIAEDRAEGSTEPGPVIGFLLGLVTEAPESTAYVHLVGIHPDHRRRGVGKELYEVFVERARAAGATRVKAITNVGNEGSIDFHRALGFSVESDPDYAGPGRARVVFSRAIRPAHET
jgi:ribosomal protein S18 acetylase RimI-like enzyme